MKEDATPRLVTIRDVSRACKVSERTVQNWMAERKIPFLKIGRNVRFDLERVLESLQDFEVKR